MRARTILLEGVVWLAIAIVVTVWLVATRDKVSDAQVVLAYLLVVLGASARRGRRIGFVIAGACFLAFNYFFVVPFGTLAVRNSLDWLVLLGFLATSLVAAQLLHRAQAEAARATARSAELQRLAALGAEALQAPGADDAALAVARVIREELQVRECELLLSDPASDRLELIACATADGAGSTASEPRYRATAEVLLAIDPRTVVLPLQVHERQVGLLLLRSDASGPADMSGSAFVDALAYYAALGLERIRLTREAERGARDREADRIKDAMLSAVSHDLRTPLTSIKALAHDIAAEGDERAADIEGEADRLNRYVENLLDLSRINAGVVPVKPELVPADDLLGVALQQVAQLAAGRQVQVHLTEDWPQLVGRFDFALTLRVLANLIENAIRYSGPSTPVDVIASRDGDSIRFEIADRGPGIPPEESERLFQPFQRGTSGNESKGAGLGLAIARELTIAQGGTLRVEPRPGGGSLFILQLPAADRAAIEAKSL